MRSARPSGDPTNRSGRPGSKLGLLGCGEGVTRISRRLRREGEPSMYGDEESGIPLTSSTIGGMPWKLLDGLVSRYV
jgi:hypothetical protein